MRPADLDPPEQAPVPDPAPDRELRRLLQEWNVPAVPDRLDQRVLASFRAGGVRPWHWRRLLTASGRLPLPVALGLAMLLLLFVFRSTPSHAPAGGSTELRDGPRTVRLEGAAVGRNGLAGFEPVREMSVTVLPSAPTP